MLNLKEVPSAPGYYADLDTGGIYSARSGSLKKLKGGDCDGYIIHPLMIDGKQLSRSAHRMVCEAAYGPCPEGKQCCHINGDKADNRAVNLRWGSYSENNGADKRRHGRLKIGSKHQNSVLTESFVRNARQLHAQGETLTSLAAEGGVSLATMKRAITGETWRHVK